MSKTFNENTRVQIPAILHLERLGYTYMPSSEIGNYDHSTNILTDVFKRSIKRLNPKLSDSEVKIQYDRIVRLAKDDELGKVFYNVISSNSGIRFIDFENINNNEWHCTDEFTCKDEKSGDNFRPDITCFINGMPLAFIEVKIPNNRDGILAERNRMNVRMQNKHFRSFLNVTQLMIFSNNQEYDNENRVPISGAFYATNTKSNIFFNVFREQSESFYSKLSLKDYNTKTEGLILRAHNKIVLTQLPEYQTNKKPTTPTNRILSSLLSKDRFLYILRYGIAYVNKTEERADGTKIEVEEKHIMRYQQMFASVAIKNAIKSGIKSGIIWHTQGSGKTALAYYTVKVLTDFFAKENIVPKFYFIVDRLDLMEQAMDEFVARGLPVRTAESREKLMEDFKNSVGTENNNGKLEIMVVNIQKFKEDHQKVEIHNPYGINLQRIFFIDEAHRGYNPTGSFLANLFDADKDSIKIALTGTPLLKDERASWKVFGGYIDKYYYDKSIADGYTLKLMREDIETVYKEKLKSLLDEAKKNNPQIKKGDIDKSEIIESENYLNALIDYIVEDFRTFRIAKADKTVGGMIVCETNPQAKQLYELFKQHEAPQNIADFYEYETLQHIQNNAANSALMFFNSYSQHLKNKPKPLVAGLILHDEGDKLERKQIITSFKRTQDIDILIVNKMLLTGFDANRLKRLYLTRKMTGHDLLQALTRVNRPYKNFEYGYVVDFADIKQNFEDTNNEYLRELNKCEIDDETKMESTIALGEAIIENKDTIIEKLKSIKITMFSYPCENAEIFSSHLDEIKDRATLYEIRKNLETAKAIGNQIRAYGDDELKEKYNTLSVGTIPELLTVVNKRIDRLNQQEQFEHGSEVGDMVNIILSQITYEFINKGQEQLTIIDNDIKDRELKVMAEFERNFDQKEPKYVNLIDEFRRYFKEKGFTPKDTADAKEKIGYMDDVMKKIKEINRLNESLKLKYRNDEGFTRIHKRIREQNEQRRQQGEAPIISANEYEIVEGMNRIKDWIDDIIFHNFRIMEHEDAFEQDILSHVSNQLIDLHITANIEDRKFIRNQIASEYYTQLNSLRGDIA